MKPDKRRAVPWTDEQIDFVRAYRAKGWTAVEMAQALERPVHDIINLRKRLDYDESLLLRLAQRDAANATPPKAEVPINSEHVTDLWNRGVSLTAIATITRRKYREVEEELRRLKLLRCA